MYLQLVEGVYVLQLTVTDWLEEKLGEATVNVTVHPPPRVNTPPIPVIKPTQHMSVCHFVSHKHAISKSHTHAQSMHSRTCYKQAKLHLTTCTCTYSTSMSLTYGANLQIVLPKNSAVFDASGSRDDLGSETLRYHWEEEAGPVGWSLSSDLPLLHIINLKEGDYKFK